MNCEKQIEIKKLYNFNISKCFKYRGKMKLLKIVMSRVIISQAESYSWLFLPPYDLLSPGQYYVFPLAVASSLVLQNNSTLFGQTMKIVQQTLASFCERVTLSQHFHPHVCPHPSIQWWKAPFIPFQCLLKQGVKVRFFIRVCITERLARKLRLILLRQT